MHASCAHLCTCFKNILHCVMVISSVGLCGSVLPFGSIPSAGLWVLKCLLCGGTSQSGQGYVSLRGRGALRTLEEGKCGLPMFQEIEQGRHCLQGMPVSNTSQPSLARLLSTLLGFPVPTMTRTDGLNPWPVLGWRQL